MRGCVEYPGRKGFLVYSGRSASEKSGDLSGDKLLCRCDPISSSTNILLSVKSLGFWKIRMSSVLSA